MKKIDSKEKYFKSIEGHLVRYEQICGYCNCHIHTGYVSNKEQKKHKCKNKHCRFFEPIKVQQISTKYSLMDTIYI